MLYIVANKTYNTCYGCFSAIFRDVNGAKLGDMPPGYVGIFSAPGMCICALGTQVSGIRTQAQCPVPDGFRATTAAEGGSP
jgi:hypothetical protein